MANKNNVLYEDVYQNNKSFSFGKNWQAFLKTLSSEKVDRAKESLCSFLGLDSFNGLSFLDIGCGSGLFSYSAYLLGAKEVISIDIDKSSIECCNILRNKAKKPSNWDIKTLSILDYSFKAGLSPSDIVYSWGVLHHTGNMYKAINNASSLVKKDGFFYIAIYNKVNSFPSSNLWLKIKKFYNISPKLVKAGLIWLYYSAFFIFRYKSFIKKGHDNRSALRGMSFYYDVIDWLGGYPYEYATPNEIINFIEKLGFRCTKQRLVSPNETGCNEFLFKRIT